MNEKGKESMESAAAKILFDVVNGIIRFVLKSNHKADAKDEQARQKAAAFLTDLAETVSKMAASLEKGERPSKDGQHFKGLLLDFNNYVGKHFVSGSVDAERLKLERVLTLASGLDWFMLKPNERIAASERYGQFLNIKSVLDTDADHDEWISEMKRAAGRLAADATKIATYNPEY